MMNNYLSGLLRWLCLSALVLALSPAMAGIVIVAHPNVHKLDQPTVQRVFTGKVIEVGGVTVSPVNLRVGQPLRSRFLSDYLQQTDDAYVAYWTVRRYVGKGAPPKEVGSASDVVMHVLHNAGAIGYMEESDVPPGVNIVARGAKAGGAAP